MTNDQTDDDEDRDVADSSGTSADESVRDDDSRETPPPDGTPPRGSEGPEDGRARRRRLEGLLRESLRKAIEKGVEASVETFSRADSAIRNVVDDVKLPKEMVGYVFSQIDETKNALVRVVANEVREFLDTTDLAGELQRALTSLSFEIKTEIRFIPNEAGNLKPKVKARVAPKRRRGGNPDAEPTDESAEPREPKDEDE